MGCTRSWDLRTFWALSATPSPSAGLGHGGKLPWSKGTAVSQLSEEAMLVKAFRHIEFMLVKSYEDESPEH